MKRGLFCLLCMSLAMVAHLPKVDAAQYKMMILGMGEARGINNKGQVVGDLYGQAFVWDASNGIRYITDDKQTNFGCALDINDNGQVVGNLNGHAFMWNGSNLQYIYEKDSTEEGYARGINNKGEVVGDLNGQAFVWDNAGGEQHIQHIFSDSSDVTSNALSINAYGQVVGYTYYYPDPDSSISSLRAFLWDSNGVTYLGSADGSTSSANCINDRGQMVGFATNPATELINACLWDSTNQIQYLGTLGGGESYARSVNNLGQVQIIGDSDTNSPTYSAFMWDSTTGEMNTLGTVTNSYAYAINDQGWIVGSVLGANNNTYAVVWASVPEPSSILAACSILGPIGFVFRRKK